MNYRVGVLTISDKGSAGEREDLSGSLIKDLVAAHLKAEVAEYFIIPDEQKLIEEHLIQLADVAKCHLILTTGGTGFASRDVTPEATRAVISKEAPGIPERMRAVSLAHTKYAVLSRATAGIRGACLIINLPGSPKGTKECLEAVIDVLPHALQLLDGDTEHKS
jgi:molybdopterin adenylyltransferase